MVKKLAGALVLAPLLLTTALPLAMAQSASSTATPKNQVDINCIKTAIDTRDSAVGTAVAAFSTAVQSALGTRQAALKAAWDLTGKVRSDAFKSAWNSYKASAQGARKALNKARINAWKQYYLDRNSCKAQKVSEPGGGQGADASL